MFQKNKNIVQRKIHDTFFLIDITQNYLDEKCRLYEINDIGDFIWNALDKCADTQAVADSLISNLIDEVDYNEVYNDICNFLNVLVEERFLEVRDGGN